MEETSISTTHPIIIEVETNGQTLSHLILFEFKTDISLTNTGIIMNADIKETIYQMKQFNDCPPPHKKMLFFF